MARYSGAVPPPLLALLKSQRPDPELAAAAPELARAAELGGIDVVAVRLWLDRYVDTLEPANVFSRFEGLRGAGGTFFMLDQLQKDSEELLWGGEGEAPQGSVLACDFYGADRLMAELPLGAPVNG